jgi:Tat protein translocase TatB subunit
VFDVGPLEILVLLIVGLLVFGPDRLPEMARQAGSWLRDLRRMVANARRDLSDGLGVDEADLRKLQNINPKSYVRRNVLDGLDLDLGLHDDKPPRRSGGRTADPAGERATKAAVDPPYDPDAT